MSAAEITSLRFGKNEKLKSKKQIDLLFAKGKSISSGVVRLIYLKSEENLPAPLVLFSASKRSFKHAVDRNRLKRQMREIYRLHKQVYFTGETDNSYLLGFMYTAKEKIPYITLEKKLISALERFKKAAFE